jgi:hypothetical protein
MHVLAEKLQSEKTTLQAFELLTGHWAFHPKGQALELSVKSGPLGSPVGSGCALEWHWINHLSTLLHCKLISLPNPSVLFL